MKKALLVMDMQLSILSMIPDSAELINNVAKAIKTARKKQIPVIFVVLGFRNGVPEISENNKTFSAFKEHLKGIDLADWPTIHPDLHPEKEDIIVTKRRVSAFTGSDLEVVLRAQNIQHLILTGIATSGIVLSTLREAADKDFALTVISDCCIDTDDEVHDILMKKIFPKQAEVISLNEWEM
ncbi:cysteine hydrolase family protein [Chryseobacterium sp. JUb7]|uniref:cysteine hydrolase family protein n=1 Tax=Chryseobacterium sp. JUb7 TaxID=2940599 RepID=UPI0021685225|nr:isochorismatase family cysteine hydrolase [Chryseobacterium sp. JUb7]MCS3532949.1 nicotinamidase-related amidase [Chryseobacterium sp. JUb7]